MFAEIQSLLYTLEIKTSIKIKIAKLREKQQDYHQKQNSMTKEDEEEYRNACADGEFINF